MRSPGQLEAVFERIRSDWGRLDFLLHSIAFCPREDLQASLINCSAEGFALAMDVSCHSFIRMARLAMPLMTHGGSLLTVSFYGADRVVENYNLMGPVKAALESSVRYLANDYGPRGIRVNGISAGPVRTLAGAGISDARHMFSYQQRNSPLRRNIGIDEVGGSALYLLSELSSGVTGEIHYVDSGYHIVSMPTLDELKQMDNDRE